MNTQDVAVITVAERLQRLNGYDVSPESAFMPRSASFGLAQADDAAETSSASVAGGAILTFVSGMTEQNKADIRHSYLFSSLVASKQFPKDNQGKEWYFKFLEVMQDCGWAIVRKNYSSEVASGKSFKMDQLVLKILGSVVAAAALPGPTSALMLKVAGDAIASLETSEKPLQVFDRNVIETGNGGFGVGSCHENPDGEVILALGTVRYIKRTNNTKVLFVNWDSSSVDLYKGESYLTMVPSQVEKARAIVLGKLGDRVVRNIEQYEI